MATDTPTEKGRPPPRWILKAVTRTHVFLHRISGGRILDKLAGDEVCFVTMTGAKSGRTITIPLMYVPYQAGRAARRLAGGSTKEPGVVREPGEAPGHRGESSGQADVAARTIEA